MTLKEYVIGLLPEEFEKLCTRYMEFIYQGKNLVVYGTRYHKDGGKDAVAKSNDVPYEIWAECKKHKQSIGLETISKNVVLVLSKGIKGLLFFSTTSITRSAIKHISRVAAKHDFFVSFYDNERLYKALSELPEFQNKNIVLEQPLEPALVMTQSISVYEEETETRSVKDKLILQRDAFFYIDLYLMNNYGSEISHVTYQLPHLKQVSLHISPIDYDFNMAAHSGRMIQIRAEVLNFHNIIHIPEIGISFEINDTKETIRTNKLIVDPTQLVYYPLVGQKVNDFLINRIDPICSGEKLNTPSVLMISGGAGEGKSRLLHECMQRAKNHGYQVFFSDARKTDGFTILREWICACLAIPYATGSISCSLDNVKAVIMKYNGSEAVGEAIYKFVFEKQSSEAILYEVQEALIYFTQKPVGKQNLYLAFDNIQCLNTETLNILYQLLYCQTIKNVNALFAISVNTEVIPIENVVSINDFMRKIKEFDENECLSYVCEDMADLDAKTLYLHAIACLQEQSMLTDLLVRKSGKRPFDIIMTIHLLHDKGILQQLSNNTWTLNSSAPIDEALTALPSKSKDLIYNRLKMLNKKVFLCNPICDYRKTFYDLVKIILYFKGSAPVTYVFDHGIDEEMQLELMQTFFFRLDEKYPIISFFHDNIYHYFDNEKIYQYDVKLSLEIITWILDNSWCNIANKSVIMFESYVRTEQYENAYQYGMQALNEEFENHNFAAVVKIGCAMLDLLKHSLIAADEFSIRYAVATAYSTNVDLSEGLQHFEQAEQVLNKNEAVVSDSNKCKFYHNYVNACLFKPDIEMMLTVLTRFEKNTKRDRFYEFILNNRYSVAYLAAGELNTADEYIETALDIAKTECRSEWESIAYSDKAYIYYRGYEDVDQTIKYFLAAVDKHDPADSDFTRESEILVQHALAELLLAEVENASQYAKLALAESIRVNCIPMEIKCRNMCAITECMQGNYEQAVEYWNTNLVICQQHNSWEGVVKATTNLAVIYGLRGNSLTQAQYHLEDALHLWENHQLPLMNHKPMLYNLIHVYMVIGQHSKATTLMQRYDFENLSNYYSETAPGDFESVTGYWPINYKGFFLNY